jgi:hypothetical protein
MAFLLSPKAGYRPSLPIVTPIFPLRVIMSFSSISHTRLTGAFRCVTDELSVDVERGHVAERSRVTAATTA